jgi:hypothetical protein
VVAGDLAAGVEGALERAGVDGVDALGEAPRRQAGLLAAERSGAVHQLGQGR